MTRTALAVVPPEPLIAPSPTAIAAALHLDASAANAAAVTYATNLAREAALVFAETAALPNLPRTQTDAFRGLSSAITSVLDSGVVK